jgi:hypothetical protein
MRLFTFRKDMQDACKAIREELEDHLDAINENSRDVADVRELLGNLDEKLEKINSRVDELYLLLGADSELSVRERAVQQFLQTSRTITEIAVFIQDSVPAAEHLLRCLYFKGVQVYQVKEGAAVLFTTNKESVKHISLNNYL